VIAGLIPALIAVASPARADTYRAVIDRIDLEPASVGGARLRVYLSALSEQGSRLDLTDAKAIKLIVGPNELKAPHALGSYAGTDTDTAIVFLIQATADYAEVLPKVADALDQALLGQLGERTQAAIILYGESAGTGKLRPLKALRSSATQLAVEGGKVPALVETLESVLPLLKRAKTDPPGRPQRKMIVIIGDGRDLAKDPERVTSLGGRAAREGVRIHSLGYVPTDKRRSLLTLGELSKRSLGTFRWIRTKDSWTLNLEQLRDEINQQYVITYFVAPEVEVAGKRAKVTTAVTAEVTSNELKIPALACNGEPCEVGYCAGDKCLVPRPAEGRGVLGWIVMLIGIVVVLAVVLGGIGYLMSRRQRPGAEAPGVPGSPPLPGSIPPRAKKGKPPKNLPSAPPANVPQAPAATTGPRLYILSGPREGEMLGLRHGFLIGAAPNSDLVIADGYASSQHAQITMDDAGNCWLVDRGSTNGTFVNGVRITQHVLEHGTSMRIGSTELRFLVQ
jgi:hypothetical protein